MKSRNVLKMVVVVMVLLAVPQMVMARGVQDSNGQKGNPMLEKYEEILTELEAGNLNGPEALKYLNQYRESLRYENREEYQLMEFCINAFENGEMTQKEAMERVSTMEMHRERTEAEEKQEEDQIREQDQLKDGTGEQDQIREQDQLKDGTGDQEQVREQDQLKDGTGDQDQKKDGEGKKGK